MERWTALRPLRLGVLLAITAVGLSACGGDDPGITVYSGRAKGLVGPLYERFTKDTGIKVSVRYGESAELAAQIAEEGKRSPADVFFSQDAGALGALAKRGLLSRLPREEVGAVDARFQGRDQRWMGVSGRARVIIANRMKVPPAEVPTSVFSVTDPKWKGRLAIAPTNASFQAFVTAMRVKVGDARAREWLTALKANDPRIYEGNAPIVRAVNDGQVDLGLVNHYYLYELAKEIGQDKVVAENHFLTGGDPGALVNVSGVGILEDSGGDKDAITFVRYLVSPPAQRYFAEATFEYPLIAAVAAAPQVPPLSNIQAPDIDLSDLAGLEQTLAMLREVGLL
jgi:iron(III) transport system substrate-binding protein